MVDPCTNADSHHVVRHNVDRLLHQNWVWRKINREAEAVCWMLMPGSVWQCAQCVDAWIKPDAESMSQRSDQAIFGSNSWKGFRVITDHYGPGPVEPLANHLRKLLWKNSKLVMIVELGGRIEVCIYKLLTVFCDHSNPHDLSVIATFAFACFKFTESVIFSWRRGQNFSSNLM